MTSIYLFGYLEDDYLGRVVVTSEDLTIEALATQRGRKPNRMRAARRS